MVTIGLVLAVLTFAGVGVSMGHGGKTHSDESFSTFEAVQKAVQLYNRLIVSNKLPEVWETGLEYVHVTARETARGRETVVPFKRSSGDPDSVYFYFSRQGEYSGSNFTGE